MAKSFARFRRARGAAARAPRVRTPRSCFAIASGVALAALAACGGRSLGNDDPPAANTKVRLQRVEFGRLADVYGLRAGADGSVLELFERDVLIGADIADERPPESALRDDEVRHDFFGADPLTLQPRLLIPRAIGSDEFRSIFDALDDRLREVAPMVTGQEEFGLPFPVVPRNAALRLVMDGPLDVTDEFFVERGPDDFVTGLRNTQAVQLLRIDGDPEQPNAFVPLPLRVVVKPNALVLDCVLLGSEGPQYQAANNAAGMPESAVSSGANMRLALPLEGPLALPGMRAAENDLTGFDNHGARAVVRDFRSGNANDTSFDLARGFVRDPLPLRMLGEIPMVLERVERVTDATLEVTVWKNGIRHEIDRGDVFRFAPPGSTTSLTASEVVVDPVDDAGSAETQHVRVRVRAVPGLLELDPRTQPGYPADPGEREAWLLANAPRALCIAEFTAGGADGRDDARNFLAFAPEPLPLGGVQPPPDQFVSPFAEAVVRFTKPVDLASVLWADTFFFATRDLLDEEKRREFVEERPNGTGTPGLRPAVFTEAKYRTPFLIASRVVDEDGSQTTLRLRPLSGFYLDDTMRNPPAGADYRYFLHLVANSTAGGIRDLAGNPLDLQGTTAARANQVVIPFTVDTRIEAGVPLFPDNLSVSVVRRYADRDEDEQPSWFLPDEVQPPDGLLRASAAQVEDVFGGVVLVDGALVARPTTRSRMVADNLNQAPVVQQPPRTLPQAPLGWCPQTLYTTIAPGTEDQRASNSTITAFGQGIQNPLNPAGCRLQTLWREIDLSLSRTSPFDFNLDIEQMYWAPFTASPLFFDEFDKTSLSLAHSEFRPAPCVGDFSSLPSLPASGLRTRFDRNPLWNPVPTGVGQTLESQAPWIDAYTEKPLTIDATDVVREPNDTNRYLPLPRFEKPYFVWRDETAMEQGGNAGIGSDLAAGPSASNASGYPPYILSPFLNGQGRRLVDVVAAAPAKVESYWNDAPNFRLGAAATPDAFTGGLTGSIALPLLADFRTLCDSSELPVGDGYVALGTNGWQVSLTVQSSAAPFFRVYSGGRPGAAPQGADCLEPSDLGWANASGGWGPGASTSAPWLQTPGSDNTLYWVMIDVLRRQSVATHGFVDLQNPHRVPEGFVDPRLGPFWLQGGVSLRPSDVIADLRHEIDPPPARQPGGTSIATQFRAASPVDPEPWYWSTWIATPNALFPAPTAGIPGFTAAQRAALRPDATNFPLDPLKAGDAHIRKWDTRNGRNAWTYFYNRTVTRYVEDPALLMDPAFTNQYAFTPEDVRYVNWRFVLGNNADVTPPVSPRIETFALTWKWKRQ